MKVALLGTCQVPVVGRLLHSATRGAANCRGIDLFHQVTDDDRSWVAEADTVFYQHGESELNTELVQSATGRVVRMPLVGARFLWPFAGAGHPRNSETVRPWRRGAVFDGMVVDDQLLALMQQHSAEPNSPDSLVDEVVETYLALDYAKLVDLDRLLARDRQMASRVGGEAGARIWSVVERDFRTRPMLFTGGRPGPQVLQLLCCELAAQLEMPLDPSDVEEAWFEMYGGDEAPHYAAPIHPSVLRHFGIEWAGSPGRFRWFYDGFLTMGEIARRAIRLTVDEASGWVDEASNAGGSGVATLADHLPQYSRSPFFRIRYGLLLDRSGRKAEAVAQYTEAARLLPPQADTVKADLLRHLTRALAEPGALTVVPRFDYDTPIQLADGEPGLAALASGWYGPESWGIWIRGFSARLHFAMSAPASGGGLRLMFRTTVYLDQNGIQVVRVFVNGRECALWRFEDDAQVERVVDVGAWATAAEKIEVTFFVAQPSSPADRGKTDDRLLGMGLSELTVCAL